MLFVPKYYFNLWNYHGFTIIIGDQKLKCGLKVLLWYGISFILCTVFTYVYIVHNIMITYYKLSLFLNKFYWIIWIRCPVKYNINLFFIFDHSLELS